MQVALQQHLDCLLYLLKTHKSECQCTSGDNWTASDTGEEGVSPVEHRPGRAAEEDPQWERLHHHGHWVPELVCAYALYLSTAGIDTLKARRHAVWMHL